MSKKITSFLKYWLIPKTDREITREIDTTNIGNIYYISLIVAIIQTVSVVFFLIVKAGNMTSKNIASAFNVSICAVMCFAAFWISGKIRKKKPDEISHNEIMIFVTLFIFLLLVWGMWVSRAHFMRKEQMLTFFTVEMVIILFLKLHPAVSFPLVIGSYTVYYILLCVFGYPSALNFYNYYMLCALSEVGSILNYRITINDIERKNQIKILNESLELIASHDALTRLKNRYALNQDIPHYVGVPVCIALGDVDKFKNINDTYGHPAGDDVLSNVADVIQDVFPDAVAYRYGGDEFLIVEKTSRMRNFDSKIKRVNDRLSQYILNGESLPISCSFGCICDRATTTREFLDLISIADERLYEIKHEPAEF